MYEAPHTSANTTVLLLFLCIELSCEIWVGVFLVSFFFLKFVNQWSEPVSIYRLLKETELH